MKHALAAAALALCAAAAGAQERAKPPDPQHEAAQYNAQLAVEYLKQGAPQVAREKIQRALEQNPRDPTVQTAAGLVFEGTGEIPRADKAYAAALRLDPKNPAMQNNYAVFQCRRGDKDKGRKLFAQAAQNPMYRTPEVAFTNAGVCARSAGNLDAAENYLRQALKARPTYPEALLQLADLSFARGQGLAARGLLQRYFASGPTTPEALLLGVKVERALGDEAAAADYAARLRRDFPASQQAGQLLTEAQGR